MPCHRSHARVDIALGIAGAEFDRRSDGFLILTLDRADENVNALSRAVIDELGRAARDFSSTLEFSPARLDEIDPQRGSNDNGSGQEDRPSQSPDGRGERG